MTNFRGFLANFGQIWSFFSKNGVFVTLLDKIADFVVLEGGGTECRFGGGGCIPHFVANLRCIDAGASKRGCFPFYPPFLEV